MANLDDFFNAKPIVQETATVLTEFKPNPKKGQNGVFNAVVRFLPNPSDPANKSMLKKYVVYLKNPLLNKQMSVDCPSTVGQQDPIQNTFFALRNSSNPILQENSKMFSRKLQIASYVQVIDCKSDPSLVGKILIWKYGTKIEAKISAEMNPPMGVGHNPFNLIDGRPFNVQVKEVGGFPNYDDCSFFDLPLNQSGMRIISNVNGQQQISVVTSETISTQQGKEMVFNYLNENVPDISRYEYNDWNTETTQFVNECISLYSNPQQSMQAAAAPAMGPVQSAPVQQQAAMSAQAQPIQMPSMGLSAMPQTAPSPSAMPNISNTNIDSILNNVNTAAPAPMPTPQMSTNLDDVLNGQMI